MNTTVYLARHGKVDFPIDAEGRKVIYGQDVPLNSLGARQFKDLDKNLRMAGVRLEVIYSTPVRRGLQSARLLSDELGGVPVVVGEGFRATHYPSWVGRRVDEFMDVGGSFYINPGPDDERLDEVDTRVWNAFREVTRKNEGKTLGIVTHGEETAILLHRLRNPDTSEPGMDEEVKNGEAYRLIVSEGCLLLEGNRFSAEGVFRGKER